MDQQLLTTPAPSPPNEKENTPMNRPLVLVVDDATDILAAAPEARALVADLLRTGRQDGLVVRSETRRPLKYPTPAALEDAAAQQ
ncbi:hypothetical protein G3I31_07570 [Streptomyces sp. SID9913]|uniref:hypothetical protein n=1 Tax=Streptomyces sp. SID9913 TaxID=2706117 RepID=UPI0013DA7320|nr:hypothetical protein [Streptomyces sp. SID9913]NED18003.1 hypothetical protein [Streptomyces sp. SID9913]